MHIKALIKEMGVIMANKTPVALLSTVILKRISSADIHKDNTAIAIAKAETLISSKRYPKQAVIITPAGYSIVNTNSRQVKTDIAFFIWLLLLFSQHLCILV